MARSESYWQKRAENRLVDSEQLGSNLIVQSSRVYDQAFRNIDKEIKNIYKNYAEKGILDPKLLKQALTPLGRKQFLEAIQKNARKLGIDPGEIFDERYLGRLSRLEALKTQVSLEILATAPTEEALSAKTYTEVLKRGYKSANEDLNLRGADVTFSTLDKPIVNAILKAKWAKGTYSSRIWNNTGKLMEDLQVTLPAALSIGQSYEKTARDLRQRFDVSRYESVRLVRTETNFFNNQAEAQSYIDDGIEHYRLAVTLDGRTSEICKALAAKNKVYRTDQIVVGKNYPPFHPHERTTTVAVFEGEFDPEELELEDRIKRFKAFDDGSVKEKWKAAMIKQMNPDKLNHDYNADMNIITQTYKGDELKEKIGQLMKKIPADYPLKNGLERIAKINGWTPELGHGGFLGKNGGTITQGQENRGFLGKPLPTKTQIENVTQVLKESNLTLDDLKLTPKQFRMISDNKIKFEDVRTSTDDVGGSYNADTNTIALDISNLRQFSKALNNQNYINRVVQHELGHAIDVNSGELSTKPGFSNIVNKNNRKTLNAYAISKYRVSDGLVDPVAKENFEKMTNAAFSSMVETGEQIVISGNPVKIPREVNNYYLQDDEIFAEAYSLYNTKPTYLKENAPDLYNYFKNTI